jgi:hypothetical protein
MHRSTADFLFEGSRRAGNRRKDSVDIVARHYLQRCEHWQHAFASQHKDHRYYEIVADTLHPEFLYLFFTLRDEQSKIQAIQPFFILDQDILAGARPFVGRLLDVVRRRWPRFMFMKTMMVGCVAGEAHLNDGNDASRAAHEQLLASTIAKHARRLGVRLIVLEEFPDSYRDVLSCFVQGGFTRLPSMPLTVLNIQYSSFDEYMQKALNSATRSKLRKNVRATVGVPIELTVSNDVTSIVDEIYPLYLQVYDRSKLHFEKLTKEYFCRLGKMMPDRARLFVWRRAGKAVAFGECLARP